MIRSIVKWFSITFLVAVLALFLLALLKIGLYEQVDNKKHKELKERYLQSLSRLQPPTGTDRRPNIVLILFDDLGYGDIGAFARTTIATPNLDTLADEGAKLTQYYAPAPVCTPSRAAMLTGRYAPRAGLPQVIFPEGHLISNYQKLLGENIRLPAEEITIADLLRAAGYSTGMVGKWHLGDHSPSLPNDMGFDYFFGAHYSNDMPNFSLFRNWTMVDQHPVDQTTLTNRYTDEAVAFIERNQDGPFFLYLAHNFPHVPLFTSNEQRGKSTAGLYGDVVEELDRSVGAVTHALREHELAGNTLVIVTSDNGPWWQGSAAAARGRKADTFEGATRVPFIAWWPGKIAPRQIIDEMASGVDILPTMLDLTGIAPPDDRMLDGLSLKEMLLNGGPTPHDELYYYSGKELFAVRNKGFKYHVSRPLAHTVAWQLPFNLAMRQGPWLFDLARDGGESYDVSAKHPEVFEEMSRRLFRRDMEAKDNVRGWIDSVIHP